MNARPFTIPLDLAQFTVGLQKGQGRVLMHARAIGINGFESAVVDACLHDQAYDPQCEGDRTEWLMNLISVSGAEARIVNELIPQLDNLTDSYWDARQRCRIARVLTQRGYSEARRCVYSALRKWPDSADVIGADDVIALDGADGLLHVVQFYASLLQQEQGFWFDDELIRFYDQHHGTGSGLRILEALSEHSTFVKTYLQHLAERDRRRLSSNDQTEKRDGYLNLENISFDTTGRRSHTERMQKIKAIEVVHQIETEDPQQNRFWYTGWGRYASATELAIVFEAMIRETELGRLCKYLRVFNRGVLPTFDTRLLRYAGHADATVRRLTNQLMSNYAHPGVRHLALERLRNGRFDEDELGLLKSNYQSGDAALIEQVLQIPADREQLHGLVFDLSALFEAIRDPESATLMLFVFEQSPCSNCRARAVKVLSLTGEIPAWLLEECPDDCSEEIRSIAKNSR